MDKSLTKKIKNALLEASNAASEFVINNFEGDFDVFNKGIIEGENLVTSIDKKSQELIPYMELFLNCCNHYLLKTLNDHLKFVFLSGDPSGFLNVPSGK